MPVPVEGGGVVSSDLGWSSAKLGTEVRSDQRKVQEKTATEEQLDKHLKELGLSRLDYNELKETQMKRHKAVHPALQIEHAAQAWKQSKRASTKQISQ
ncbi:hypothetical protein BGZ67_003726 [Mortierella alpina]|nr:hypothetical protein BGZ67_003726 [Mortierella alpina]